MISYHNTKVGFRFDQSGDGNHATPASATLLPTMPSTGAYVNFSAGAYFVLPTAAITDASSGSVFTATVQVGALTSTAARGVYGVGATSSSAAASSGLTMQITTGLMGATYGTSAAYAATAHQAGNVYTVRHTPLNALTLAANGTRVASATAAYSSAAYANAVLGTNAPTGAVGASPLYGTIGFASFYNAELSSIDASLTEAQAWTTLPPYPPPAPPPSPPSPPSPPLPPPSPSPPPAAVYPLDYLVSASSASGMFALNRLFSSYSGPIVRVCTSTFGNQTDMYGGAALGTLATSTGVTLAAWKTANGGVAYVTTWYDQSGAGNDARQQFNPALLPRINAAATYMDFQTNGGAYFNLPIGTVPSQNTSWTTVSRIGSVTGGAYRCLYAMGVAASPYVGWTMHTNGYATGMMQVTNVGGAIFWNTPHVEGAVYADVRNQTTNTMY